MTHQEKATDYMAAYALLTTCAGQMPQSIQDKLRAIANTLKDDLNAAGEFHSRNAADHLIEKYTKE